MGFEPTNSSSTYSFLISKSGIEKSQSILEVYKGTKNPLKSTKIYQLHKGVNRKKFLSPIVMEEKVPFKLMLIGFHVSHYMSFKALSDLEPTLTRKFPTSMTLKSQR